MKCLDRFLAYLLLFLLEYDVTMSRPWFDESNNWIMCNSSIVILYMCRLIDFLRIAQIFLNRFIQFLWLLVGNDCSLKSKSIAIS